MSFITPPVLLCIFSFIIINTIKLTDSAGSIKLSAPNSKRNIIALIKPAIAGI